MNHPVWLKVVCIGCIVLGGLGLAMGIMGIVGPLVSEWLQAVMEGIMDWLTQGAPKANLEPQKELQRQIAAVQASWLPVLMALAGIKLLVASLLLAGGIRALRMRPSGRTLLITACALAIVFELGQLAPTVWMQWDMSKSMKTYADQVVAGSAPQGANMSPAQKRTVQTVTRSAMMFGVLFGVAMAIGMAAVKIGFYGLGIWIMRKPHIRERYTGVLAPAEVVS